MNELNKFNVGKSHESNPLGGIPIGNGNSVEEGETKFKDFVYSDRFNVDKSLLSQFNLPGYIAGKSYAKASEVIENKFKDRSDKYSNDTKKELLNRLAQAHEYTKLQENLKVNATQAPDLSENPIPEGMEEFVPQNKMFLGGLSNNIGNISNGVNMFGNSFGNTSNVSNTPRTSSEMQTAGMWESTKDTVSSAIPIFGSLFRGAEKAGKGLGQAIGGDKGGDIATGFLDPVSTITNKDTSFGEKTLALMDPIASGLILAKKNKARREEAARNQHIINSGTFQNDFALGGNTRTPVSSVTSNPMLDEYNLTQNLAADYYFNNMTTPTVTTSPITTTPISTFDNSSSYTSPFPKANLKPILDWTKNNAGSLLRYAPVAANALQLKNLERPNRVRLNRLDNRYNPQYVDERVPLNIINNEYDNTINALTNATNGSLGSLRSNILAAGANKTKALSDTYMGISDRNRQQNSIAQQFNLGIDQTNLQQANTELDINDRNSAAYENNKSKLIAQLGNDLGNIGKEEVYKKIAENAYGYNWLGEYMNKNPKATKEEAADAFNKEHNVTSKKSYGGFISKTKYTK